MFIYLLAWPRGIYKIGISRDPEYRLTSFNSLPVEIKLLHKINVPHESALVFERVLHTAFSHRRVNGEWFRIGKKHIQEIMSVKNLENAEQLPPSVRRLYVRNLTRELEARREMQEREKSSQVTNQVMRLARKAKGLTCKQVGDATGYGENTIRLVEAGVHRFAKHRQRDVAEFLGVPESEMFPEATG